MTARAPLFLILALTLAGCRSGAYDRFRVVHPSSQLRRPASNADDLLLGTFELGYDVSHVMSVVAGVDVEHVFLVPTTSPDDEHKILESYYVMAKLTGVDPEVAATVHVRSVGLELEVPHGTGGPALAIWRGVTRDPETRETREGLCVAANGTLDLVRASLRKGVALRGQWRQTR